MYNPSLKSSFLPILLVCLLGIAWRPAVAGSATYDGNGNTSFGGGVGDGSLTVSDDGSGGVDFQYTLGNGQTGSDLGSLGPGYPNQNNIVIYLDNGTGGGIGADTSVLDDTGIVTNTDGGRMAVSEYGNVYGEFAQRSILNFGGLMDPLYAIDLAGDVGQIYELNAHGGFYNWIDGTAPGDTGSTGLSYSISGNVVTLDLPSADFGLSGYSGATLNFVALEVSETGFSSGEATATLTGAEGWGNTQTLTSVNSFTAVPEPGSWGLLAGGLVVLSGMPRLRRMRRV